MYLWSGFSKNVNRKFGSVADSKLGIKAAAVLFYGWHSKIEFLGDCMVAFALDQKV